MKKQNRSRLMASIHETAKYLHEEGVIDNITLCQFDDLCLTSERPEEKRPSPKAEAQDQRANTRLVTGSHCQ
jgi:hypothetical protein